MKCPIEAAQLLDMLPHRQPMLMIDRIIELEPGKRAVGLKNISIADPVFVGHFPSEPIYPGVLLIESSAHVAGLMMADEDSSVPRIIYLAQVSKFKFLKPVHPGDQIMIEARMKVQLKTMIEAIVTLTVGSSKVAEGVLAIALPEGE